MEYISLVDENGKHIGRKILRGEKIDKGLFFLSSEIWIMNSKGEFLIQKRASSKKYAPNLWAMTGGACIDDETTLQAIIRETKEELNIDLNNKINDIELLKRCKKEYVNVIMDIYFIKYDIDISEIIIDRKELSDVKWAKIDEIFSLLENNEFIEDHVNWIKDELILKSREMLS